MNTYTLTYFNVFKDIRTSHVVEAETAQGAIAKFSGMNGFDFTRKNQNDVDEADRDNAYAQVNAGRIGWAACRQGCDARYAE